MCIIPSISVESPFSHFPKSRPIPQSIASAQTKVDHIHIEWVSKLYHQQYLYEHFVNQNSADVSQSHISNHSDAYVFVLEVDLHF
jgi:hypothetical protein